MPSPFPGMDPYFEDPCLWQAFHRQLTATLSSVMLPGLTDRYRLGGGSRRYTTDAGEHQEDYIEIREQDGSLVTLLDIVSPANKTTGTGRKEYLSTRGAAKESKANVVEIDLVMQGLPTLDYSRDNLPEWDHAVTVTRSTQPERYEIYTATLQKRLPKFRLPLAANDRDTVLDLQTVFAKCYDQGGYSERIDYCREPPVPLSDDKRQWLDGFLQSHGLRKPLPPHDEIALVAYRLWEQAGRPQGRHQEHWFAAMAELRRVGPPSRQPSP
jgi:hypothetical protein